MMGKEFRQLRQLKKISLDKACKGITSKSSLQRWENGQGKMSCGNLFKLLERIHIQPKEFIDLVQPSTLNSYVEPLENAYKNNDVADLKNIAEFFLGLHYHDNNNRNMLFQAAIACNYYMDFTNVNLMNENDILRLKAYFLLIEEWDRENVFFFVNTQLLLSGIDVYKISRSLISYLVYDETQQSRTYTMAITTLINGIFVLLKKQEIDKAYDLFEKVRRLNFLDDFLNEKIKINYLKTVFHYLNTKDVKMMEKFLHDLDAIGLKDQADAFRLGFSQFKKIIDE